MDGRRPGEVADSAGKTRAERYKSRLIQAADKGEAFDTDSGLPDPMAREVSQVTWYEHACAFTDARWPKHAAKGRMSLAEGLTAVTVVLVKNQRGAPDPGVLREGLRKWAFNPPRRDTARPPEIDAALRWLAKASLPVSALEEARMISKALDACGKSSTARRQRPSITGGAACLLRRAEIRGAGEAAFGKSARRHPGPGVEGTGRRPGGGPAPGRRPGPDAGAARCDRLDRPDPGAAPGRAVRLHVLRHAAAIGGGSLLRDECHLPDEGWGRLEFREVSSAAGREWTDDGEVHEARKPKGGPKNAVRRVPIPPELVSLLRKHIGQHGTAPTAACSAPAGAASTSRPPSGRCCGKPAQRRSRPLRSTPRWPAGPTTSATPESPGGSTPGLPVPRWPSGPGTASRCSTGSTPTASTATTSAGTSEWRTSFGNRDLKQPAGRSGRQSFVGLPDFLRLQVRRAA